MAYPDTLPDPAVFDLSPEIFSIVLDEIGDALRKLRCPSRNDWIPWRNLGHDLKEQWRDEANLVIQHVNVAVYARTLKVGP